MKKLVFLLLFLFCVNFLQAQKISIGFVFAPQITCSNLKNWKQITPLHTCAWYQSNENFFLQTGYTVSSKNLIFAGGYKSFYAVNLINMDKGLNFFGVGMVFPFSKFNPSLLFIEPGTLYSFKGENKFPLILSTGIFIPFKKLIFEKTKGS